MSTFESLTYATTKQSIDCTLGVANVAFVYGQLSTSDTTRERLLRAAIAIQERDEHFLFEGAYSAIKYEAEGIRNDAVRIARNYQQHSLVGSRALAAANLFHGSIDRDGMDFEIREPFVECNILQLLHMNPKEYDNPEFYMRYLETK